MQSWSFSLRDSVITQDNLLTQNRYSCSHNHRGCGNNISAAIFHLRFHRAIDCVNWSKTSHVFDMASYRIHERIKNLSSAWYGELFIAWVDQKLTMCFIWQVIDCMSWSKTSHVFDMASFWLCELIKNWSCAWYGKILIAWVDRKLVMCLIWQVFDYVSWSKTRHVLDMASYWLRELIEN